MPHGKRRLLMRERFSGSLITVAIAGATLGAGLSVSITQTSAQAPAPALATPWGAPALHGIWMAETDPPPQRPAKPGAQKFFTRAQPAEVAQPRAALGPKHTP